MVSGFAAHAFRERRGKKRGILAFGDGQDRRLLCKWVEGRQCECEVFAEAGMPLTPLELWGLASKPETPGSDTLKAHLSCVRPAV